MAALVPEGQVEEQFSLKGAAALVCLDKARQEEVLDKEEAGARVRPIPQQMAASTAAAVLALVQIAEVTEQSELSGPETFANFHLQEQQTNKENK